MTASGPPTDDEGQAAGQALADGTAALEQAATLASEGEGRLGVTDRAGLSSPG